MSGVEVAEKIARTAWENSETGENPDTDRRTAVLLLNKEDTVSYMQAVREFMRTSPKAVRSLSGEVRKQNGDKDIAAARRALKRLGHAYESDAEGMINLEIAGKDIAALGMFSVGAADSSKSANFFLAMRKAYINEPHKTEPPVRLSLVKKIASKIIRK